MKYQNLGPYKTINQFVNYKLASLQKSDASFNSLYELMFSEGKNIFFEYSLDFDVKKVTYQESKDHIAILSRKIASLSLKANDVIAIYLDNDLSWLETFWAILKSGARPLLLNMRLDDTSLEEAIKEVDAKLVISKGKKFKIKTITYEELLNLDEKDTPKQFGEEILFMSSGTTNNVKICAYSAKEIKNILAQSASIIKSSRLIKRHYQGELKLLTFLPFYHIFGFVAVYVWFSFFARTFVSLKDLSPLTIRNTINKHKVTHIFAVPLFWQMSYEAALKEIKKKGEKTYLKFLKGMKISSKLGNSIFGKLFSHFAYKEIREGMFGNSISYLISGGSNISKDVLSFFNNIGYHLTSGYGMTEIGITSVELDNKYKYLVNASIGKPLDGVTYKINENNELLVKGKTLAKYIISNHQKVILEDEFFNTHDLMEYKNGRYYFLARSDDLIVGINGENLNPNIIEERIRLIDTPNLALVANKDNSEIVLLVEFNKYLSKDKLLDLDNRLKENIKKNKYASLISKIVYIKDKFINGDEFKINRKKLADDYFASHLSSIDLDNNEEVIIKDEIIDKLISLLKEETDIKEIDPAKNLFLDYGLSSLDYYALANKIYDEFEVDIVKVEYLYSSINEIANFIKEKL
ncbi:MAG: AMP-binding protein [Bacilli bacterium]|nr:AMP-binding protein [Bacilli bacterium]